MDALQPRHIPDLKRDGHILVGLLAGDFTESLTYRSIRENVNAKRSRQGPRLYLACKCPQRTTLFDVGGQPAIASPFKDPENTVKSLISGASQSYAWWIVHSAVQDGHEEVQRPVSVIDCPRV